MSDPFDRVPKKHPKIYFSNGDGASAVWFDPEIGTPEGRQQLIKAIQKAKAAFWRSYSPKAK